MADTLVDLLSRGNGVSAAILAPSRAPLTYHDVRRQVAVLAGQLNTLGIGAGDRVAIVLPNGPEMALTFLAVASCATAAPLNPAYRTDEFRFYLDDLNAKALIALPGEAAEARAAASAGTLQLDLEGQAGNLSLSKDGRPVEASAPAWAPADEVALVLHTSGTTARPKIVPLSQRNLVISAGNVAAALALTDADRCLNVMPLFHIHGLVAALLASMRTGASVACTPGFDGFKFFAWMDELKPTWYTAVPTMHQIVLSRAERQKDVIARNPLRFIRSSSSPMPPIVMERLEAAFGAPLIEAYGMTEAAHQMATNPLPPGARKPGSVGRGASVDVAIMGDDGSLLVPEERGEVVIKGGNVTAGYANNPAANAEAFRNGWFRTGDQGYLDQDGYLYLTGRLKEIINRGGEKISPREIDEVLLQYPGVAQAVAFAIPHDRLGEDVAAAVTPADGTTLSERELRAFAAERLADFKVPRTILILDEIPKGPTGKLARVGLAAKLGLA
jgi:acyl-CoA synthetase (AMP-forming)/AMP-acid ligase II